MVLMDDKELIKALNNGSEAAMETLYKRYYGYLCQVAHYHLRDSEQVKDIVQDLMLDIWNRKETLLVTTTLKTYLTRALIYKINRHKQKHTTQEDIDNVDLASSENVALEAKELAELIDTTIESMPARPKECFQMSRDEGLTYKQIAEKLNLSHKTVDHHITKAISILRTRLRSYFE